MSDAKLYWNRRRLRAGAPDWTVPMPIRQPLSPFVTRIIDGHSGVVDWVLQLTSALGPLLKSSGEIAGKTGALLALVQIAYLNCHPLF
jgi:hypothetical protein